jgi:hypothetical protein
MILLFCIAGIDILDLLKTNIPSSEFEVFDSKQLSKSTSVKHNRFGYYLKLGSSRMGLALPGIGADCYRTWEQLTMGLVVVAERTAGLDRTVSDILMNINFDFCFISISPINIPFIIHFTQFWRLPVLLVDRFEEVTSDLLRTAYVEALYRKKEFEFERLTQSFWWTVISNVSVTQSADAVRNRFPAR